jgi:hypothetical protein
MTIIEIIVLVLLIVLVAGLAAYQVGKSHPPLTEMFQDINSIEVKAEQVVSELYNKDLRHTTTDKPQVTSQDNTPEVIEKVVKIVKVTPEETTTQVQPVVEKVKEAKAEFPIDKPKKKRKHYPKKLKTTI